MKDLGWTNGWKETPPEVKACDKKGHRRENSDTGWNCVTRTECAECGYYYMTDSGD